MVARSELKAFWSNVLTKHPEIRSDEVDLNAVVPYGFFYDSGTGSSDVTNYPVYFDVNMNISRAKDLFQSLVDGQYLDKEATRKVIMEMILFNPEV